MSVEHDWSRRQLHDFRVLPTTEDNNSAFSSAGDQHVRNLAGTIVREREREREKVFLER